MKKTKLPRNWRKQTLAHLNDNLATWEIADNVPPKYMDSVNDYVVSVRLIEGGEHLKQFDIELGQVYGFLINLKLLA